jgi:hypothetical protein
MNQLKVLEIIRELEQTEYDDDVRQEVWVKILETGNYNAQDHLSQVIEEQHFRCDLEEKIKALVSQVSQPDITSLIAPFSPNQQSIIIMIMLGYSLEFIARYKNMCNLRFTQTLKFISKHEVWGEYLEKKEVKYNPIIWPDH